jgi:hypothetical protein
MVMKHIRWSSLSLSIRTAGLTALFVTFALSTQAQSRVITKTEYDSLRWNEHIAQPNAVVTLRTLAYFKETADGVWKPYSVTIWERIKPDRERQRVTMWYRGFEEPRTDFIRIGDKAYSKHPDGKWYEQPYRVGTAVPSPPAKFAEYRHLGYEMLAGRKVTIIQKTTQKKSEKDGVKVTGKIVLTDWIDETNRRTIKSESVDDSAGQSYAYMRLVWEYDYESKVSIEPPQ